VHELAHWLAHRDVRCFAHCTVFEYEAEAVEALVMARLGLTHPEAGAAEDLLSASAARVHFASDRICGALGLQT